MVNLEIVMNDGITRTVEVSEYNVLEIEEDMNNRETLVIAVGDSIFNKNLIKMITPAEVEPNEG